jgi:hypothetical protein
LSYELGRVGFNHDGAARLKQSQQWAGEGPDSDFVLAKSRLYELFPSSQGGFTDLLGAHRPKEWGSRPPTFMGYLALAS